MDNRKGKLDINLGAGLKTNQKTNPIPAADRVNNRADVWKLRYYDTSTGQPLPLDFIESRIRRNLSAMDRMTAETALDLYFIHRNWGGFYDRGGMSFKDYLKDNFGMSRAYAYDIIKITDMLIRYEQAVVVDESMPDRLGAAFDQAGVANLKLVSQVKQPERQAELLKDVIEGRKVSAEEILAVNRGETKPAAGKKLNTCEWVRYGDIGYWKSSCVHSFIFNNGGSPTDNGFVYCPYCGKKLSKAVYHE